MDLVDGLFKAANYSEIWTYSPSIIRKREDMEAAVRQWLKAKEHGTRYPFVIHDKVSDEIVGSTSYFDLSHLHRKLEIGGTWLDPKVWRTRINTECKFLLLEYAFEEINLIRVQFRTDTRNEKSNRAIQRSGASYEGTIRQDMIMHDGYIRNSNLYSILNLEWGSVKSRLLQWLS